MASGSLANGIANIVAARTLGRLKENSVMSRIVSRDWDDEVAEHGDRITISKSGALVAPQNMHQGADLSVPLDADNTHDQPADTPIVVILDNHKGIPFSIGSFTRTVSKPNQLQRYTVDAARGMATDVDTTLIVEVENNADGSFTANGGAGTDVLVSDLIKMDEILNVALAPPDNRFAVWHPLSKSKLLSKGIFAGHEATANLALSVPESLITPSLQKGVLGERFGFMHMMDQNVSLAGTVTGTQGNIGFVREGIVLATRPLDMPPEGTGAVSIVMDEDELGLRVTMGWNTRRARLEVVVDFLWGVKLIRTEFAVSVRTDL